MAIIEDGNRPIYDLMSPEIHYTDQAIVTKMDIKDLPHFSNNTQNNKVEGSLPNQSKLTDWCLFTRF